ncbi:MAG: hypothetical protein PHX27_03330 [Candidatus ainarchaeum sp.]|nr:hypothetical protein [Candidatus ainarchaeum sp.]
MISRKGFLAITSKGFLFTISIILFASTIVIFSQVYSDYNSIRESRVLSNYSVLSQSIINDNISSNLKRIIDFDYNYSFESNKFFVSVNDSLPKKNLYQKISGYKSFLENNFFKLVSGDKQVDFSNVLDGNVQLFFGDSFVYDINYNNNITSFISTSSKLNSVNLNLIVDSNDLNYYEWVPSSGTQIISLHYTGDVNNFFIEGTVSDYELSYLNLVYSDSNTLILFNGEGLENSVSISSTKKVSFNFDLEYVFDNNYLPVWFDSDFNYFSRNVNSNSKIIVSN